MTRRDEPAATIRCLYCNSVETELFSLFGQTLLGSQYHCRSCHSFFEVVRFDDADDTKQNDRPVNPPDA